MLIKRRYLDWFGVLYQTNITETKIFFQAKLEIYELVYVNEIEGGIPQMSTGMVHSHIVLIVCPF